MLEKARQQDVFSVRTHRSAGVSSRYFYIMLGSHTGRSNRWSDRMRRSGSGSSAQALAQACCRDQQEVAIDFDFRLVDGEEVSVSAAVDCETLEVLAVDVSSGRSRLDALLFLKDVLKRRRGRPLVRADRGL